MKLLLNLASRRYFNQRALKWGFLLTFVALLLLFALQTRIYVKSRERMIQYQNDLTDIQQQLGGKPPSQMTPADIQQQQEALTNAQEILERDAFRWTALFDRLESYLPGNVSIRSLNPDYEKETLTLGGICPEVTDLRMLLDNLHQASFEQVFLNSQGWTKVKDYRGVEKPALTFSIKLEGVF